MNEQRPYNPRQRQASSASGGSRPRSQASGSTPARQNQQAGAQGRAASQYTSSQRRASLAQNVSGTYARGAYQARSFDSSAQNARTRARAAAVAKKRARRRILIGSVAAIVVAVGVGIGAYNLFFKTTEQADQELIVTDASKGYHSSKLNGATETTDSNNVVHGTSADGVKYTVVGRGVTTDNVGTTGKVSLAACGDIVSSDWCLDIVDAYAGTTGDGLYDYTPYFKEVRSFLQNYDLRYINPETCMANSAITGYPVFNSPDALAAGVASEGFNLVNLASNHLNDCGTSGVTETQQVWAQYAANIVTAGSYTSQEERETVHMIERDGINFAYLAYTGVDNMYGSDPDNTNRPNSYYLCMFDKEAMAEDIARAKQVADVIIVSMHWGEEYTTELNDVQNEYAQFLVEQDVDLVLGSHSHILQPIKVYTSASGKQIPVCFGLSDFICGWTLADTNTSGIFTCDFEYSNTGVTLTNAKFYPCVEWSNDNKNVYIRMLKDLSDEELSQTTRAWPELAGTQFSWTNVVDFTNTLLDSIQFDVEVIR